MSSTATTSSSPADDSSSARNEHVSAAVLVPTHEALDPVDGDLLPRIGSEVLIHLARQNEWVKHTVAGYYVWGDHKGDPWLQRVFVRVRSEGGHLNARMLCEVRKMDGTPLVVGRAGPKQEPCPMREAQDALSAVSNPPEHILRRVTAYAENLESAGVDTTSVRGLLLALEAEFAAAALVGAQTVPVSVDKPVHADRSQHEGEGLTDNTRRALRAAEASLTEMERDGRAWDCDKRALALVRDALAASSSAKAEIQPTPLPSGPDRYDDPLLAWLDEQHPDDAFVDSFAYEMKLKLKASRDKGRSGWQTCPPEELSRMLREHVEKGDPRDVAIFCMFLWSLKASIFASGSSDLREAQAFPVPAASAFPKGEV